MSVDNTVSIIPFSPAEKEAIKTLNLEWLQKYFRVEPKDEIVLSDPQGQIIDKGGIIFYAKYKDEIVGTVSLIKIDNTTYELSKMAVTDGVQGLGIGKKLMLHCIAVAEEKEMEKLILYSNRKLLSAIHLYDKFGFVEIPLEDGVYERADIKMERIIR
ncbi:GNAT family N-acetyltransferase [Flavobacterium glaciei]|uniref:Acetyltransferase (GNAT) family protein n=1 Tax=Flavobacterium glaciei TaxID=386300 RepID=A0A562PPJ2_9FLAO|nr:GNAT family N-acetyltransferase [Flavobacterium glaciei]RDI53460.1 acetyltransferase (GNAT) family protein [Flavobacterium glaciei]TWI46362.1 acetyltransferase (GNAT) family protein [Flavobacterium glaciei]